MASRPQTLVRIADSPVGLAAWLLDHNDADGQPAATVAAALDRTTSTTGELTRDEILDNITLYWLTNTGSLCVASLLGVQGRLFQRQRRLDPGGRDDLSWRAIPSPAELDRTGLSQADLLQRGRQGRPLRGLGAARLFAAELRAGFRSLRQEI